MSPRIWLRLNSLYLYMGGRLRTSLSVCAHVDYMLHGVRRQFVRSALSLVPLLLVRLIYPSTPRFPSTLYVRSSDSNTRRHSPHVNANTATRICSLIISTAFFSLESFSRLTRVLAAESAQQFILDFALFRGRVGAGKLLLSFPLPCTNSY